MLKTSGTTESTTRPGKGGVGVGGDGRAERDGVDDGGGCSGDSDIQVFIRLLSTFHPRVQQDPFGATSSMLRTSSSTDSSTSATQIAVEYDGVDGGGGQLVEKSSKSRRIVKESKSFKGLKNLQRPSVRRNVYRSTDPPSIRYEELELPLEL